MVQKLYKVQKFLINFCKIFLKVSQTFGFWATTEIVRAPAAIAALPSQTSTTRPL